MRILSIAVSGMLALSASGIALASEQPSAAKGQPSLEERQKILKEVTEKREKIDFNTIQNGQVVAKVHGQQIAVEDVAKAMGNIPAQLRQNMPPEFVFRAALDQLIDYKVLQHAAEAERKTLEAQPQVKEAIKQAIEQVILKAYMDDIVTSQMTEKKIRSRYNDVVQKFPKDTFETKVRQILVKDEKTAKEITQALKDGGDFLVLARQKSMDKKSAERDGDIGYVNILQKNEIPELGILFEKDKNGKFVIPTGSYTPEPIALKADNKVLAYAIFKVDDRKPFVPPKYEDIKPMLKEQIGQEMLGEKTKELREKAKVERLHPNTGKPMAAFEEELKGLSKQIEERMKTVGSVKPEGSEASKAAAPAVAPAPKPAQ